MDFTDVHGKMKRLAQEVCNAWSSGSKNFDDDYSDLDQKIYIIKC